ncbi:helix-turn-helix transcriptional regulator [Pseudomonas asplenii]|uniref:AraC family transcriptional regulator n=1 Tax=Pseudomonas asplenii TaxID=53407 RepID=UPI0037CAC726
MQSGIAQATRGGESCNLQPGSLILLDFSTEWDLVFPSEQYCLSAHMEFSWLKKWIPDPSNLAGWVVNGSSQWAAPLISMMNTFATMGLENAPMPRALLAEQMASLLAIALARPTEANHRHGSELFKRIRARVRNSFEKADLSAQQVAEDLGISRRHLDKVLASGKTTFLTMLENQRFEAARRRLADHHNSLQIAEIAWSCGFSDPGYFARRFRRVFGTSPTCFREQGAKKQATH